LGTLIARPEVVDLFNRVRDPFNVNSLAQVAGIAIFNDKDFINQVVQMTWDGIDYFVKELKKMNLKFVEPQGNFLFFDTQRDAQS
ncbi:aminotransferase class I/II-fold pyridoxal phosphate-dependent enzyme, partial [Klebsiella pneumoniae]|uniref:aminotransferase class I/II-fold pyridoxal phosphate-dependent enzyme n=1 Tax=Klebsiella pneumoniae TaxID=573 RepID=UPI003EE339B9